MTRKESSRRNPEANAPTTGDRAPMPSGIMAAQVPESSVPAGPGQPEPARPIASPARQDTVRHAAPPQPREAADDAAPPRPPEPARHPAPAPPDGARHAAPPVPNDPQALAEDIRQTREQLGEALQALIARTDVKAMARERASRISGRIRGVRAQAGNQAKGLRGQVTAKTPPARRVVPVVAAVGAVAGAVAIGGYLAATRRKQPESALMSAARRISGCTGSRARGRRGRLRRTR